MDIPIRVAFQNRFLRKYQPIKLELGTSGHLRNPEILFKDSSQYIDQMFNAESTRFSDAKCRNVRTTWATNNELDVFRRKTGSYVQVPILNLASDIAYTVFGNRELRHEFNLRYNGGIQMPKFILDIYAHIRETQNNQVIISYGNPVHDDSLLHLGLAGTILDVNTLLRNESLLNLAFSILLGVGWCDTYGLPFDTFNQLPSVTTMTTVSSIDVSFKDGKINISVYPFSNIKQTNYMYDPTIKEALHCIFGGVRVFEPSGSKLVNNIVTSVFELNLSTYDYAFYKVEFLCDLPVAFLNPSLQIENSKTRMNNAKKDFKTNGLPKETIPIRENKSMMAYSGEKTSNSFKRLKHNTINDSQNFDQILLFANNLYSINKNYFAGFVRINKLYNLLKLIN